jgi:hypothetical protein
MPSPFPGMDPYLEAQPRWEIFHGWFIHKLAELALATAASMGCWIDVERDVYGEDPSGATVLIGEADEVLTIASTESTWSGHVGGAATLAVPRSIREVVVDPEEAHQHRQHFLVVREWNCGMIDSMNCSTVRIGTASDRAWNGAKHPPWPSSWKCFRLPV